MYSDKEPAGSIHRFEKYEWCRLWWENANDNTLPRALLVGDSIAEGYHPVVKEMLSGRVHVDLFASSRAINAPVFTRELNHVLELFPYRVIHFNSGLHGWNVTACEYRNGLEAIVKLISDKQPHAKLALATSTPVTKKDAQAELDLEKEAVLRERNRIVYDLAAAYGFPVNDLYRHMIGKSEIRTMDGYHYLPEGQRMQAVYVAAAIEESMEPEDRM